MKQFKIEVESILQSLHCNVFSTRINQSILLVGVAAVLDAVYVHSIHDRMSETTSQLTTFSIHNIF